MINKIILTIKSESRKIKMEKNGIWKNLKGEKKEFGKKYLFHRALFVQIG